MPHGLGTDSIPQRISHIVHRGKSLVKPVETSGILFLLLVSSRGPGGSVENNRTGHQ